MILELTPEQRAVLLELIQDEINEIGPEIHHTWKRAYRDDLKDRRRVLLSLRALLAPNEAVELAPGGAG